MLIKHKADPFYDNEDLDTPILICSRKGDHKHLYLLLESRNFIEEYENNNNALYFAVYFGFIECIKLLVERGISVDGDALILALSQGRKNCFDLLASYKLDDPDLISEMTLEQKALAYYHYLGQKIYSASFLGDRALLTQTIIKVLDVFSRYKTFNKTAVFSYIRENQTPLHAASKNFKIKLF